MNSQLLAAWRGILEQMREEPDGPDLPLIAADMLDEMGRPEQAVLARAHALRSRGGRTVGTLVPQLGLAMSELLAGTGLAAAHLSNLRTRQVPTMTADLLAGPDGRIVPVPDVVARVELLFGMVRVVRVNGSLSCWNALGPRLCAWHPVRELDWQLRSTIGSGPNVIGPHLAGQTTANGHDDVIDQWQWGYHGMLACGLRGDLLERAWRRVAYVIYPTQRHALEAAASAALDWAREQTDAEYRLTCGRIPPSMEANRQ